MPPVIHLRAGKKGGEQPSTNVQQPSYPLPPTDFLQPSYTSNIANWQQLPSPNNLQPESGIAFSGPPDRGPQLLPRALLRSRRSAFLMYQEPIKEPGKLRSRRFDGDVSDYEHGVHSTPAYLGGESVAEMGTRNHGRQRQRPRQTTWRRPWQST